MTFPYTPPSWYSPISRTHHERLSKQVKVDLMNAVSKLVADIPELAEAVSMAVEATPNLRKVAVRFFDAEGKPVGDELPQSHPLVVKMLTEGMIQHAIALFPDQDVPLITEAATAVQMERVPVHVKDTESTRWKIYASHPPHLGVSRVYLAIPSFARYRDKFEPGCKVITHVNKEKKIVGLEILPPDVEAEGALKAHIHSASIRIDISRSINLMGLRPTPGSWVLPDPQYDPETNQIKLDFSAMPEVTDEEWAEIQEARKQWKAEQRAKKGPDRRKLTRAQREALAAMQSQAQSHPQP